MIKISKNDIKTKIITDAEKMESYKATQLGNIDDEKIKYLANLFVEDKFEFNHSKISLEPELESARSIILSTILNIIIFLLMLVIIFELFFLGKYYYDLNVNKKLNIQSNNIYNEIVVSQTPDTTDIIETETVQSETISEGLEEEAVISENAKLINTLRTEFDNADIIGYLEIENTAISYPLVQYTNNNYYTEHSIDKSQNQAGAIFMDHENSSDFKNFNTILYGHNMKNGSMFHNLRYYVDKEYFEEHKYIKTKSVDSDFTWEVFSFYDVDISFNYIETKFNDFDAFDELRTEFKERSIYDTGVVLNHDDIVLTLSTCTNTDENSRFVLHARLIETIDK